ncbi:MAG TPA: thiamine phosphate synthase [Thermoanaerobacterales bacterium]|jgi:thiamine-phosphate pyrophosphorylase|nr:thiamine phosphate synthase [Thermoanaerobacterales bacterium]
MKKPKFDLCLYLVADRSILGERDFVSSLKEAIEGGVTLVQLREKTSSTLEFYNMATQAKRITDQYHVPLIINDRIDIAIAVDAAGVHLGQDDMPAKIAREILGPDKIIGISASTISEAISAQDAGADYLGVGSVFPTTSKDDAKQVTLETLKAIKQSVKIPIVGIGGINQENIKKVIDTGVDGAAVISAIFGKKDIKKAAEQLKKSFN